MTDLQGCTSTTCASGMFRLKKAESVQLSIPEAPEPITRETLQALPSETKLYLVDVRTPEEYATGAITNSVSVPFDTLTTEKGKALLDEAAASGAPSCVFVFVSMQSPDLDQAAALQLMQANSNKAIEVYFLQGGMVGWVRANGGEGLEQYDASKWESLPQASKE